MEKEFHNALPLFSRSLLFFLWPKCIPLHTKQGPIRPNLHCPIYWCRFRFVAEKAEAFSLIPPAVSERGYEGLSMRGNLRWLGWYDESEPHQPSVHLHRYRFAHLQARIDNPAWSREPHIVIHHIGDVRLAVAQQNPRDTRGIDERDEGRKGWREGEQKCWQDCDRA